MTERILIASGNPWSFCMAVEREMARSYAHARVDALNLFTLCSRASPHWRVRDKLIETLDRKFERLVLPAINGRDITSDIRIDRGGIPPLPESYEALRAYEIDGQDRARGAELRFQSDDHPGPVEPARIWPSARVGVAIRAPLPAHRPGSARARL
jgi:hypothetical protein